MNYIATAFFFAALAFIAWVAVFGQDATRGMELRGGYSLTYDEFSRMW